MRITLLFKKSFYHFTIFLSYMYKHITLSYHLFMCCTLALIMIMASFFLILRVIIIICVICKANDILAKNLFINLRINGLH